MRTLLGFLLAASMDGSQWLHLEPSQLCITEGGIGTTSGNRMSITASKVRAVASVPSAHSAEIRFVYQGATAPMSRLGSGEIRQQLGLKLRAADACNVVYAMWRFAPESQMVVSVKHNPGMHQSSECGNHGYQNIKPRHSGPVATPLQGEAHILRAEMRGREMTVTIDGRKCWEGNLGPEAIASDGPVGLRSDNVQLEFELLAGPPEPGNTTALPTCADC